MSNALAYAIIGATIAAPTLRAKVAGDGGKAFEDYFGGTDEGSAVDAVQGAVHVRSGFTGAIRDAWDFISPGGLQGIDEGGAFAWSKFSDAAKSAIKENLFVVAAVVVVGVVGYKIYKGAAHAVVPA